MDAFIFNVLHSVVTGERAEHFPQQVSRDSAWNQMFEVMAEWITPKIGNRESRSLKAMCDSHLVPL